MRLATILLFIGLIGNVSKPAPASPDNTADTYLTIVVTAVNPVAVTRADETIAIDLKALRSKYPGFNPNDFYVTVADSEIPSQIVDSRHDGTPDRLLVCTSFRSLESKSMVIHYTLHGVVERPYPRMTQAQLGMKTEYSKINGCYTGGRFSNVDSTVVPPDHFAHDALYRIEGPGWESKWIVYRYYLDSRNRNDIFGKKTHDLVLQKIGVNDLVSDSKESYTNMLDWGMDIFKVGESLGIGSIAMWHNSEVVTVSKVDRVECRIPHDGPILSDVLTSYSGWSVGKKSYNLTTDLSISGGSRETKVDAGISDDSVELCTGLAKHSDCELVKSSPADTAGWSFIGLYGRQSLAGDNLGIAIFYRKSDCVTVTEDSLSYIAVLRPAAGKVTYYFGAAWDKEPGGITDRDEFARYLKDETLRLGNPIAVSF